MNSRKFFAVLLIVLGCISLTYEGISYTRREKVFQVGSLVATADTRETIPLSPIVGGLALVAGVVLLAVRRDA
jgi:hypothetical protein